MKKILSISAALAVMISGFSLTSCGKRLSSTSDTPELTYSIPSAGESAAKVDISQITGYYSMELISTPDDICSISDIRRSGDNEIVIDYSDADYNYTKSYLTDTSFSNFTFIDEEIPQECIDADYYYAMNKITPNAECSVMYMIEDHGGLKMPYEYDENFDYDTYNSFCEVSYIIANYDENSKLINTVPFELPTEENSEVSDDISSNIYFVQDAPDSMFFNMGGSKIYKINKNDFSVKKIYEADKNEYFGYYDICFVAANRDNSMYLIIPDVLEGDDSDTEYYMVDQNLKFNVYKINDDDTISAEPFFSYSDGSIEQGYGKYKFIVNTSDMVYGVCDDGSTEEIINWNKSDITQLLWVLPIGNDEFLAIGETQSKEDYRNLLYKLVPADPSALAEKTQITVGTFMNDGEIRKWVNNFNRTSENYHVEIVTYGEQPDDYMLYDTAYKEAKDQLCKDLISGNAPDVFIGLDYPIYQNLASKGVFADLDQFMDGSGKYSHDDFVPGVLNSMKSGDGKIYAMPESFSCMSRMVKTKFWDKPTWTLDEMIEFYDNAPDTAIHLYDGYTKDEVLNNMVVFLEDLIDYSKEECHFDSEDFIKVLEFCNRFVGEVPKPDKGNEGADAVQMYWTDRETWFGRDMELVIDEAVSTWFNLDKYLSGYGEDMTFVGYPTKNGGSGGRITPVNTISIAQSCEDKNGAWEFLIYYIGGASEENYLNSYFDGGAYSCFKERFEKQVRSDIGAEHTSCGRPIPPLTEEDADMIIDYIYNCDGVSNSFDYEVLNVINEEADRYFAGGCSAEDAAKMIQNRVSIMISE